MKLSRFLSIALTICVACFLLSRCGKKRPPAVTGYPNAHSTAQTTTKGDIQTEPLGVGPDVQPMGNETPTGEDIWTTDPTGEGGPLADIHFDYDQATLTDEARTTLGKHAAWLKNHRSTRVTIEGHCDERGTVEYNLALGDQRARVIRDYLTNLGVAAEYLSAVSYGKERPVDSGHVEGAWAKNRRAHFSVSR